MVIWLRAIGVVLATETHSLRIDEREVFAHNGNGATAVR
jgi:hypothetical protein